MNRVLITLAVVVVILAGELIFPIQVSAAPPAQGPEVGKFYELLRGLQLYSNATMTSGYMDVGRGCTLKVLSVFWAEGVLWVKVTVTNASGWSRTGYVLEGLFHDRSWLRLMQTVVPAAPGTAPWIPAPVIPIFPNPNIYPWHRPRNRRWS